MISLEKCKNGYIYELKSRNLISGVFNESTKGFIGIRTIFDSAYLFTEYHYETGEPFGTAMPMREIGKIPDDIEIKETLGVIDQNTKKAVQFDKPITQGGKGWYFIESGESGKINPISISNKRLIEFLSENFV